MTGCSWVTTERLLDTIRVSVRLWYLIAGAAPWENPINEHKARSYNAFTCRRFPDFSG